MTQLQRQFGVVGFQPIPEEHPSFQALFPGLAVFRSGPILSRSEVVQH